MNRGDFQGCPEHRLTLQLCSISASPPSTTKNPCTGLGQKPSTAPWFRHSLGIQEIQAQAPVANMGLFMQQKAAQHRQIRTNTFWNSPKADYCYQGHGEKGENDPGPGQGKGELCFTGCLGIGPGSAEPAEAFPQER